MELELCKAQWWILDLRNGEGGGDIQHILGSREGSPNGRLAGATWKLPLTA